MFLVVEKLQILLLFLLILQIMPLMKASIGWRHLRVFRKDKRTIIWKSFTITRFTLRYTNIKH